MLPSLATVVWAIILADSAYDLRGHKCAVLGDVQGRCFCEPDVAIYSRPFVKPSLFHSDVNAHGDYVIAAVIEVIGDIVLEAAVAGVFRADIEAVNPEARVAMNAVKFDDYPAAEVRFRDRKLFAIPADAVSGNALPTAL